MDSFDTDMGDRGPTAFALLTIDASEACGLYGSLVKAWPASLEKERDRPEEAEDWLEKYPKLFDNLNYPEDFIRTNQ